MVGPEGSGKTTFLRALEKRGAGRYLSSPAALAEPWGDERLLVDGLDGGSRLDDQVLVEALGRVRRAVIAVRGAPLPAPLVAASDGDLPIYPTRDLLAACQGALPSQVAERVATGRVVPGAHRGGAGGGRPPAPGGPRLGAGPVRRPAGRPGRGGRPLAPRGARAEGAAGPHPSWFVDAEVRACTGRPSPAPVQARAPARAPAGTRKRRSRGKGEPPP